MPSHNSTLTLVYSCSGCSSAAQLANNLAIKLDRAGLAEMSCIAGIGGHVPSLLRKAHTAVQEHRPILAIDGCALVCVHSSLAQHGIRPTAHLQLGQEGVRKAYHSDFDENESNRLYEDLAQRVGIMNGLSTAAPATSSCGGSGACRCANKDPTIRPESDPK